MKNIILTGDRPTGKLHIGHYIALMTMAHMQRAGHRPIALLGGGRLVALGAPRETATPAALAALYSVSERAVAECLNLG